MAERSESERAELVALNEWLREPDYAENFSLADVTDWINRRPIATVARLAAQDQKPFGWLGKDGKFSLPAELTREQLLSHFADHDLPTGTPVIPLYISPQPAPGWNDAIEAAAKHIEMRPGSCPDRREIVAEIHALRHTTPPDSGADTTIPDSSDMDARFAWLESKAIDMGYVLVPEPEHPDSPHREIVMPDHGGADAGVRVRPLEWDETHRNRSDEEPVPELTGWQAETELGFYSVDIEAHIDVTLDGWQFHKIGTFDDIDEAKAAAQADYEKRILSALSKPAPVASNASAEAQGDGEAVDLRDLVLQQIKRARKAGESQEMLARWICEVVRPLTYAPPTEAKDKELAALREEKVRFYSHNPYSEHNEVLKARAETAERRVAESEASWRETLRKERDSGLNATRLKEQFKRERDEAREALKAEPTTAMIDAGVAFALNVSLPGEYRWSQYVADLYKTMRDAATRAAIKQGE